MSIMDIVIALMIVGVLVGLFVFFSGFGRRGSGGGGSYTGRGGRGTHGGAGDTRL